MTITWQHIGNDLIKDSNHPRGELLDLNPRLSDEKYLAEYEIDRLNYWTLNILISEHKKTYKEIIDAAKVIKKFWDKSWKQMVYEVLDPRFLEVGAEAVDGPSSFRTWHIYSSPSSYIEELYCDEEFIKAINEKTQWNWSDIHLVLVLWFIDEAAAHANRGSLGKSAIWIMRAHEQMHWSSDTEKNESVSIAKKGGIARSKIFEPLRLHCKTLVENGKYQSRRNAAISITDEILIMAREMGIPLSPNQATLTITQWLKDYGLPANI